MAEGAVPSLRSSMPTQIGRYRIIDRIGRGAMGVVYSAHDEVVGRPVALKVLMADLESDPESRARFYREAQAAARLVHPNVITIFDAGEDQGRSFIAMQLLEGAPLPAYLKGPEAGGLERRTDLMIQLCQGLVAAHGQGVIHRDLKPNNLFVQTDGSLKILDFGVARLANSNMTAAGMMLGTPDYMSPEQARGEQVDARSDIFSAGAVFYYILAGRKPFPGPDLPNVLHQLQFDEPAPLRSTVPPELAGLVRQAMAKAPAERPETAEDLLAALVRFRRQYQSETRKLVLKARARFDAVETMLASVAEAEAALGLPADAARESGLRSIEQRFPLLSKRASGTDASGTDATGTDATAVDRELLSAAQQELVAVEQQLAFALDTASAHTGQLEAGKRALASGDARTAIKQFEAVTLACPRSPRARELMESCRPLAAEQQAREERIGTRIAAARRAVEAQDWTGAKEECQRVLALVPGHELATVLLREAEQEIEREQQRLAVLVQRLLDRASLAVDRQEFDDADAALREADAAHPGLPAVARLRQKITDGRAAAKAAEQLRQLSADEIRRARGTFRRGRYDEAVQQLRGFLEAEPGASGVEAELKRLLALREAIASAAAASRRDASELLNQATLLAESGALSEATDVARLALQSDPTDVPAATLLDRLLARQLEERIASEQARTNEQRFKDVEPLLAAARTAFERGYIGFALKVGLAAQRIAPHRADAAAFVEAAKNELASEDRETFELVATPFPTPTPPAAATAPQPSQQPEAGGVFDWAAHLLGSGSRRRKA